MIDALKKIFRERRFRRTAWLAGAFYAAVYLLAAQVLVFSGAEPGEAFFSAAFSPEWPSILFRQRAPFLFESIGVLNLTPYATIFLSVPNILLAAALGALVGANFAVSHYVFRTLGLRGAKGAVTLLGTIPAILGGAACCVPTLILVLGLQFTATLSAVWPWLVPASFIALTVGLLWALRRAKIGA
jgi:hypothetical protein